MLTLNWAPHYAEDLPEQGLTTALVKAAFRAGGHRASVEFVPWSRALKEVEEGKADVVMGAYYNEDRTTRYIYSDLIYDLQVGLITRPGFSKTEYASLRELAYRCCLACAIYPDHQNDERPIRLFNCERDFNRLQNLQQ